MVLDLANFVPYSHAVMKHRYRPWTATVLSILLAIGAVFSNTAAQGQDAANRPWPSVPQDGAKGRLAIVIDDVGYNRAAADAVIALPFPLTVSVLPHHPLSVNIANQAWRHGKQVLLHLPMEPQPGAVRPEDIQLRIGMEAGQIESLVAGMLETVPHAVGVSNHQGALGVCRNNAKRVHSTTSPSHFGTILASGADASALKTDRLWGGHPTFSSRHDFSDTLLARLLHEHCSSARVGGVGGGRPLDFVLPDLLGRLTFSQESEGAVGLEHDFGRLGVGVVVDGGHGGAVCAGAADDDEVSDLGARHP